MLIDVVKVTVLDGFRVRLLFEDGLVREIDLDPYLSGPVFEPVRNPKYFRRVRVDRESGTIAWPNGADICRDTLYHAIPHDKLHDMAYLRSIPGLLSDESKRTRRAPSRPRAAAAKSKTRKAKSPRTPSRRRRKRAAS